jgi:hypothetical protein
MHIQSHGATLIKILQPTPLHRQRKGRRRPVKVMNHAELAAHFGVEQDQLKAALIEAGWSFHEDAAGKLWASVEGELS